MKIFIIKWGDIYWSYYRYYNWKCFIYHSCCFSYSLFCEKKNKKFSQPGPDDSRKKITVIKTSENENNLPNQHEPGLKKANPILIFFESAEFGTIRLYIDFNKTIDELIRCYFNEIKRPELYRDKSFSFLVDGECLHFPYSKYSKAPVENLISKIDPFKTITIVVNHNKEETE